MENLGNNTSLHWEGHDDVLIGSAFEIDPMYRDPRYHRPRCSDGESENFPVFEKLNTRGLNLRIQLHRVHFVSVIL